MIKAEHLTKCYGDFMAVNDLSFEIEEGHVYGFLGPNGAGKSTTMNMMTGCLSATAGKIMIGGHDIFEEPEAAKKLIGYLPEQPPLYLNETPMEYLRFVGEAKGLRGQYLQDQIEDIIFETGLQDVDNQLIGTLSKGYKQRVGIAQALLGNPGVIILDEPTVGLDPIQIIEIRELIRPFPELFRRQRHRQTRPLQNIRCQDSRSDRVGQHKDLIPPGKSLGTGKSLEHGRRLTTAVCLNESGLFYLFS